MQAAVTGGAALIMSAAPNAQYLTKTVKSMNLHEYQGKQLFAEYGLPVSRVSLSIPLKLQQKLATRSAVPSGL